MSGALSVTLVKCHVSCLCCAAQVRTLEKPNPLKATYTMVHMLAVLLLASVPSLILNLPVGIIARCGDSQHLVSTVSIVRALLAARRDNLDPAYKDISFILVRQAHYNGIPAV